jgi:UDP-glucose 4-epimerase
MKPVSSDRERQPKPSCIVLGGGGFIGTNLCRRLVSAGHRVRAFGRRCQFPQELRGAEWYQGDFTDATALAAALESFDVVFHLVHSTTPQSANLDMAGDVQGNVVASLALFDLCRKLKVRRLVFVSSGGTVYGLPNAIPTPETAPTDPIGAYGVSKLAIEKYLAVYGRLHGLDYRILRVTNPYGPFQVPIKNQGLVAAIISKALRGETNEIWGDGSVIRDYIFIDDVIDALVAAASDQSEGRIFNIGSGVGRNVREAITAIELALGKKLDVTWKQSRAADVPASVVAIERARDLMGWVPKTSLEAGLAQTIQWWQSRESER